MKRGTPDHPKTKRLARILGLEDWGSVGILERLWHFTAKHAIRGDIGKWSDAEIADAIGWKGDLEQLLESLVQSGWLDRNKRYRLLVHDWHDHADDSVRKTLKNRGETFATLREKSRTFPESSGTIPENAGNGSPQPKPSHSHSLAKPEPDPFDLWWAKYPRREGKQKGCEAWGKAVDRLVAGGRTELDAIAYLLERVTAYAASPRATKSDRDKIPLPATWLNGGRYEDDPAAWGIVLTATQQHPPKPQSVDDPLPLRN